MVFSPDLGCLLWGDGRMDQVGVLIASFTVQVAHLPGNGEDKRTLALEMVVMKVG
jgi:hypothetical protein